MVDTGLEFDAMITAYERLAVLPDCEAKELARAIAAAEARLSQDELSDAVSTRVRSWTSMEVHQARRAVSIYMEAADELDEDATARIREATQEAIAKLPPEARRRLQALTPGLFKHNWPERHQEEVGGHSFDAHDAHIGTPVYSTDEQHVGDVAQVEGKYVQILPPEGDEFWLSVSVIVRATDEAVSLELTKDDVEQFALRDHSQLEAGLDAPDPAMDERIDPQATEDEKEARREGLVRDDDGSA